MRNCPVIVVMIVSLALSHGREWTNKNLQSFEGDLTGFDGEFALITRSSDGMEFRIPITDLSLPDQAYLLEQKPNFTIPEGESPDLPESIRGITSALYRFDEPSEPGKEATGQHPTRKGDDVRFSVDPGNGFLGGAAKFNGKNSIFYLKRPISLRNQPFTLSCWIRTESTKDQEIFSYGRREKGVSLYTDNRTVGFVYRWNSRDEVSDVRFSQDQVTDGKWHHLCGTVDQKGNLTFWVDGQAVGNRSGQLIPDEPVYGATLGAVGDTKSNVRRNQDVMPFDGWIDEVLFLKEALDENAVKDLYQFYAAHLPER